ncbi:MAG TPA: SH3 domain-containing protein [Candidatus Binatia bacterium]|nr:SH3 domain-containing protein [Candidatus Binatia bacterium]
MTRSVNLIMASLLVVLVSLAASACKSKEKPVALKELPDLNEQTRAYVTVERTKVRAGPGTQFRAIADIGPDAKVNVVGKDGDWVLIVSKKGNAPGYIEMASVKAWEGEVKEGLKPQAEGKYETVADTQVRSGPGLHYPVVANIAKGTKLNVVEEEKGWLKVESKRGNKPGYVDASLAKPAVER